MTHAERVIAAHFKKMPTPALRVSVNRAIALRDYPGAAQEAVDAVKATRPDMTIEKAKAAAATIIALGKAELARRI